MANEKDREPEFTVTDRRKFNLDELLNSPAEAVATETTTQTAEPEPPVDTPPAPSQEISHDLPIEDGWDSPSEADQSAQTAAYLESHRALDSALDAQQPGLSQQIGGASFERLVALISTQALLLMGALAPEGQQPRVDVVGARQQIDLLEVLKEKTKGNLDVKEQSMIDNTLFELRMMFIEIMNAFAAPPAERVRN